MHFLVVDDEPLARRELGRLLGDLVPGCRTTEAACVAEAETQLMRGTPRPEAIFLDVQLAGETGFDLLERLPGARPPVVFVTAHEAHAVRSFDFEPVDYLLKPVDPALLRRAVDRCRQQVDTRPPLRGLEDHFLIRDGGRCWWVPVAQIQYLRSESNYTEVHYKRERPWVLRSLGDTLDSFEPGIFFRANPREAFGLRHVREVVCESRTPRSVCLANGMQVDFSKQQARAFAEQHELG